MKNINKHLTEQEIQDFAFDKSNVEWASHVAGCEHCKTKTESYQMLFSGIKEQAQPAFDFDLSSLVFAQLPKPQPKFSFENAFIYLIFVVTMLVLGVGYYFMKDYLVNIFTGLAPILIFLIASTLSVIFIFQAIETIRKYQKQMRALSFY